MDILDGSNLRINIIGADSSVILDGFNRTVMANIVSAEGNLLVDYDLELFLGEVRGNVRGAYNNILVDTAKNHINAKTICGDLVDEQFNVIYDSISQTLHASIVGDLFNSKGDQITDIENKIWHGSVQGPILDSTGTVVFDNEMDAIKKDIVGNLFTNMGEISFDFTIGEFYGSFVGNLKAIDGATVYDHQTGTLQGNLSGDVFGNLIDSTNTIFINTEEKTVSRLTGELFGSFFGDIFNDTGGTFYDSTKNQVTAETAIFKKITGDIDGDLTGNIIDPLSGSIILDSILSTIKIDLIGDIYDVNNLKVFDSDENVIRINELYSNEITSDMISIPSFVKINRDGIKIESDRVFSEPAIELRYFREFEPPIPHWFQIGLEMCMAGGTMQEPEPVRAGQKLPGIVFSAALEIADTGEDSTVLAGNDDFKTKTYVSAIYAQIPEDAEFRPDLKEAGLPGDLIFVTGGYGDDVNYMKFDCTGKLHATLAELDVDGETGILPNNTVEPDSWLQVKVNGEVKFIPLYS
jgi:hypothetical protein